jgi:regulator of PEP synthase PpsR (kinase-PPPase family)
MIRAVLTQFKRGSFTIKNHTCLTNEDKVRKALAKITTRKRTLVLHALIDPDLKNLIDRHCDRKKIPHHDMTGTLVQFLADHSQQAPENDQSRLHRVNEGYHQRIEAMEYTAQHDDNRRIETAREADVVILGLSRTSKSPTSTFLSFQGYKVANIALAPQMELPKELKKIPPSRMVGLTMQPKRLAEIRQQRFAQFDKRIEETQGEQLEYGDLRSVIHEIMWLESTYRKLGIPMINVTSNTIEETAAQIIDLLNLS